MKSHIPTLSHDPDTSVAAVGSDAIEQILREYPNLLEDAAQADVEEHALTFRQAFRKYRAAALWSMLLSACLIMEGYDLGSVNSYFGQPEFVANFGQMQADGTKAIPAKWQTGISNGALCGEMIGLALNGWAQERFGYKKTILTALFVMGCAIFVPVFSKSLPVLLFGFIFEGIPWGVFQTLTTSYAAEICPQALRPYLTSYVNFCWGAGLLLSSGVVRASLSIEGNWSWRMPFTIQWFWVLVLPLGIFFAPESQWWLVRQGRYDDARKVLRRLRDYTPEQIEQHLALMRYTTELERRETAGTSYVDCFRSSDRRRTEIGCMAFAVQQLYGGGIIGYSVLFFQRAGLSTTASFDVNIVLTSMYCLGTIGAWFLMQRVGLRSLYVYGLAGMAACLLAIGVLGFFQDSTAVSWAIGALMISVNLGYNLSIGPACYSVVGMVPSGKLRGKSVVLSRMTYNLVGVIFNIITPRMVSESDWNWGAKAALFFLGTNLCSLVWCFFRLPEIRNRSYAELDILFANGVSARKFASTAVDRECQDVVKEKSFCADKGCVQNSANQTRTKVRAMAALKSAWISRTTRGRLNTWSEPPKAEREVGRVFLYTGGECSRGRMLHWWIAFYPFRGVSIGDVKASGCPSVGEERLLKKPRDALQSRLSVTHHLRRSD